MKPTAFDHFKDGILKKLDITDILIIVGAALVVVGIWQIYRPAAWICAGLALLFLGLPPWRKR